MTPSEQAGYRRNLRRELARLRDAGAGDALLTQDEVLTLAPGVQCDALAFATREEAEASARDLMGRWMLVTDWRVIESDEPVNYTLKDGVLESVGGGGVKLILVED